MEDSLGNVVTSASMDAVRAIDAAIDLLGRAWPGSWEAAQRATQEDPGLAIGYAVQALMHASWGRRDEAIKAIVRALDQAGSASARERSVIELVDHVVRGRTHAGLAWLQAHLRRFPSDRLALMTGMGAYGLFAFSGLADHNEQRLRLLDQVERHYPAGDAWLLAYRGWARIEAGSVDEGLAMALRAIELQPRNAHNAHIIAHGFHEAGRFAQWLDFLSTWLPDYPDDALMWGHLQWHAALAELGLGRDDAALHRCLGPIVSYFGRCSPFMGLADVPSLLWRLGLRGFRDLPWARAAQHASEYFPNGSNAFGEIHLAMLAAAQRDPDALASCGKRLERIEAEGYPGARAALAWVAALQALLEGRSDDAQRYFQRCEDEAVRLGGSNAQRSVISATRECQQLPEACA